MILFRGPHLPLCGPYYTATIVLYDTAAADVSHACIATKDVCVCVCLCVCDTHIIVTGEMTSTWNMLHCRHQ